MSSSSKTTLVRRIRDLVLVVVAFAIVAGLMELAGAPRALILPVWLGVVLALASPPGRASRAPSLRRGAR